MHSPPQARSDCVQTFDQTVGTEGAGSTYALPHQPKFGRFVILRQLGTGGMGTVFAAYDEQLDRKVALKLVHSWNNEDAVQHQQTLREAKALARVAHPRVISIYEVGEADGRLYLTMEFVDGITLRRWQTEGTRHWRDIVCMYVHAGDGLRAAHAVGVVHRDFKPDNVLIGPDGLPRVADFGLASLVKHGAEEPAADKRALDRHAGEKERPFTLHGVISGTPGYMSPEQHQGMVVAPTSDQFSFCAALYEALYGNLPFIDDTLLSQAPSSNRVLRSPHASTEVPEEIFKLLQRGLAASPSGRFPSMDALLTALRSESEHTPAGAWLTRYRLILALSAPVPMLAMGSWRLALGSSQLRQHGILTALLFLSTLGGVGYLQRRALSSNVFHRRMWTLLLIHFAEILLERILMTFRPEASFGLVFGVEMIIWTGTTTSMATLAPRPMWWVPLIPFSSAVLSLTVPCLDRKYFLLSYFLVFVAMLWSWWRAGTEPR